MRKRGRGFPVLIFLAVLLLASSCGASGAKARTGTGGNAVEETLQSQAAAAEADRAPDEGRAADTVRAAEADRTQASSDPEPSGAAAAEGADTVREPETAGGGTEPSGADTEPAVPGASAQGAAGEVDYDLTEMGSDMVYATVFKLMQDPLSYEGKTFRMEGQYYSSYYEPTGQNYHFCIIADALGCCKQGMEFIWGDGTHVYPDEYPPLESNVIVTGTFETYQEEGDESLYCHITNAELEPVPAEAESQQEK